MAQLMPGGKQQYFDGNGNMLSVGKVYTYAAGTDTPLATYTDAAGGSPNTNPVVLNARGEATIFWAAVPYKVVVKDASDVEIWTVDVLKTAAADLAGNDGAGLLGFAQDETYAAGTVGAKLQETISCKDFPFLAYGDNGVHDDTAAIQAWLTACEGKRGYAPLGTYVCGALLIPSNIEITGDGALTVFKAKDSLNADFISNSNQSGGNTNITLRSFAIDGNKANQTSGMGIDFFKVTNVLAVDIEIDDTHDWGFALREGSNAKIVRGHANGVANASHSGYLVGGSTPSITLMNDVQFWDVQALNNGQDGITLEQGSRILVNGGLFTGNGQTGVKVAKAHHVRVVGAYAKGNTNGFKCQTANQDVTFAHCTGYQNNDSGLFIANTDTVNPSRNIKVIGGFYNDNAQAAVSTSYGIAIENSAGATIDGLQLIGATCLDQGRGISASANGTVTNFYMDACDCRGNTADIVLGAAIDQATAIFGTNIGLAGGSTVTGSYPSQTHELRFWANNVAASSGTVLLSDGFAGRGYMMKTAGYVKSATARGSDPTTAGQVSFNVRKSTDPDVAGTNINTTPIINTTNPTIHTVTEIMRAKTFAAGDYITVVYNSDASFAPSGSTDFDVIVEVVYIT